MKINPCICLTKQQKIVACSCSVTGINSALIVPAIKGQVFTYQHPLSYFSNCKGMIKQGSKYLKELEQQILAGLFISSYQHFELLDLMELTAQEANAILCTASQATLIEALELVPSFTQQNVVASPIFAMEWKNLQPAVDVNQELANYVRRLAKDFITPLASQEDRRKMMITVLNKDAIDRRISGGYTALSNAKVHLSDSEKDFEDSFKENKKEAKRLIGALAASSQLTFEFINFLKTVNKDRNMITMSASLRDKIVQKLNEKNHPDAKKLSKLIAECINPYDLDVIEPQLPTEAFEKPRVKSLKEILADKRRQSQIMATSIEEVEDLHEAMDRTATQSVEDYDAAIDEEELKDLEEDKDEPEALDDHLNSFNSSRSFSEEF